MGAKISKEDGLTAASIERLNAAKAAAAKAEAEQKSYNSEPRDADDEGSENEEDVIAEDDEKQTSDSSSTSSDKPPKPQRPDTATTSLANKATAEALRNAAGTSMPNKVAVAGIHLTNAISALWSKSQSRARSGHRSSAPDRYHRRRKSRYKMDERAPMGDGCDPHPAHPSRMHPSIPEYRRFRGWRYRCWYVQIMMLSSSKMLISD
jgi:hypothetical protein